MTATLLLAAVCVMAAAVVGGATGFATSLLVTPALVLLRFDLTAVVAINLTATLVTRLVTVWTFRHSVDRRAVGLLAGGSLPGAVAGSMTVGLVDDQLLKNVAGLFVVLAGLHMLCTRSAAAGRTAGRARFALVGTVGGYLSTTISLNGPPVAILLGRTGRTPTQFVADFAGYFVAVNSISLTTLALHDQLDGSLFWPVIPVLVGAAMIGNRIGTAVHRRIPVRTFRPLVSLLVVLAGVITVAA